MRFRWAMTTAVVVLTMFLSVSPRAEESEESSKAKAFHNAGVGFFKNELYEEAVEQFQKAVKLDPGVAKYHFNLAMALDKTGNPAEAIEEFQKYMELDPYAEDLSEVVLRMAELRKLIKEKPEKVETSVEAREGVKEGTCSDDMVLIPSGSFMMGSPANEEGRFYRGDRGAYEDEEPMHEVQISSFCMTKTEVTQAKWVEVMGSNPSYFLNCGGHCPVDQVSWFDAVIFCNKLSSREGLRPCYRISGENVTWDRSANGYRLPTEAEWEYACRAGTTTRFYTGNSESDLARAGWYGIHSGNGIHPVGQKASNAWGLYDMHGNVWEWCWDWYDENYYSGLSAKDPEGPFSGSLRVIRGGGWHNGARLCRSAVRCGYGPVGRCFLGFRLSRSAVR